MFEGKAADFIGHRADLFLELMLKNVAAIIEICIVLLAWYLLDRIILRLIVHLFKTAEQRAGSTVFKNDKIRSSWLMYRMLTLRRLAAQIFRTVLGTIVCFIILDIVGINIKPILAGIGIAGLGISLAAQNLIRDFINGILIIVEDQYNVNDWVSIGEFEGTVETFTLRITRLRSLDGNLIVIPNSSILSVVNYTKDWAYAMVYVMVPYDSNYVRAKEILTEIADETVRSGDPDIFPDPIINGITDYTLDGVQLRCRIKTAPGSQWAVSHKVREELLKRYNAEGIKFSYHEVSNRVNFPDYPSERAMIRPPMANAGPEVSAKK